MKMNSMMTIALSARKKDSSIAAIAASELFIKHVSTLKGFQSFGIVNTAFIGIIVLSASSLNHRPRRNIYNWSVQSVSDLYIVSAAKYPTTSSIPRTIFSEAATILYAKGV